MTMDRTKWERKRIEEVCEIEYGKRVVQQRDGGTIYPVYGGGGATFLMDTYNRENRVVVSRFAMSPRCTRKVIGKFFLNDSGLTIKSISTSLLQQYLDTCILSLNDKIYQLGRGVAQKNLKVDELLKITIPIPSHEQQIRVVAELDKLNEVIALKRKQLSDLNSLAQSLFYEMFGDPVENEKGWEVKKLDTMCSVQNGLVNPKEKPFSEMYHVGPANIVSNTGELIGLKIAKEENLISGKYYFEEGMILYSKIRPNLNKVTKAYFKGICSADMYPLIPTEDITSDFLLFILKSKRFLDYAITNSGRANIPKINREALMAYSTILPPLPLQQSFSTKVAAIESEKQRVKASLKDLETLLASRMQYWFG